MSEGQGISRELGIGDVVSRTFDLYRRDFRGYFIIFLAIEIVEAIITKLVTPLVSNTSAGVTSGLPTNSLTDTFGALFLILLVTLIVSPIAIATAIGLASAQIEKRQTNLGREVHFAVSRLLWIWAVVIVTAVCVFLGLIALIVPGIIIAIMFSLAIPAVVIESPGVLSPVFRSRHLVSHRWLKTFGLLVVFGLITLIGALVFDGISSLFGVGSFIVDAILSSFLGPLLPIALTVYYYSNVARTTPPPQPNPPGYLTAGPQPGAKYCPNCGTQLAALASFCYKCGAQQPGAGPTFPPPPSSAATS